ncbi:MAG: stage III sporulation protein AB [Firmicutes bacterium]|nr:stage III sporulation protein AB [Bacillota bacterium]
MIEIKLIGVILITLSCGCTGYVLSQRQNYRFSDVEELKKGISFYKGCVNAMDFDVAQVFSETSKRLKGAVREIFVFSAEKTAQKTTGDINMIWKDSVDRVKEITFFDKNDMETVYSFGAVPGFMDRQQQSEAADMVIKELETIEKDIEQKKAKEENMFRSCGVLCGLLISILLF